MAGEVVTRGSGRRRKLSLVAAIALGTLLFWLAIRGVAWSEVVSTLRQTRVGPLVLALPILGVSYFLRGERWAILLGAEAPVPPAVAISASLVGYLANGYLPARAGEPIRAALISRHTKITLSGALATALAERLVDAALLVVIAITAVARAPGLPEWLRKATGTMAVAAVLGLATLFVAPRFESFLQKGVRLLPVSPTWSSRLEGATRHFLGGLRALHDLKRALPFLGLCLLIWTIDASVVTIASQAVRLTITFPQALALLSALGLASAAPSTPGYLGVYQFVAVSVLTPLGAPRSQALVFIVAFQALVYVVVTIGGTGGLWYLGRRGRR